MHQSESEEDEETAQKRRERILWKMRHIYSQDSLHDHTEAVTLDSKSRHLLSRIKRTSSTLLCRTNSLPIQDSLPPPKRKSSQNSQNSTPARGSRTGATKSGGDTTPIVPLSQALGLSVAAPSAPTKTMTTSTTTTTTVKTVIKRRRTAVIAEASTPSLSRIPTLKRTTSTLSELFESTSRLNSTSSDKPKAKKLSQPGSVSPTEGQCVVFSCVGMKLSLCASCVAVDFSMFNSQLGLKSVALVSTLLHGQ